MATSVQYHMSRREVRNEGRFYGQRRKTDAEVITLITRVPTEVTVLSFISTLDGW